MNDKQQAAELYDMAREETTDWARIANWFEGKRMNGLGHTAKSIAEAFVETGWLRVGDEGVLHRKLPQGAKP